MTVLEFVSLDTSMMNHVDAQTGVDAGYTPCCLLHEVGRRGTPSVLVTVPSSMCETIGRF